MKFEHTVRYPTDDHKTLVASEEKFLNKMANDGWELCCVLDINSKRRVYYFKRLVVESYPSAPVDPNIWVDVLKDIEDGMTILELKSKYKITKI